MTALPDLLDRSRALLDGTTKIRGTVSARAAAWLARSALEQIVVDLLLARGIDSSAATMRSRLSCLRVVEPSLADDAEIAWWGLSRCCHHHAFELSPNAPEVSHLVCLVDVLRCG